MAELPDGNIYKQRRSGPLRASENKQHSTTAEKEMNTYREKRKGNGIIHAEEEETLPSLPQSHTLLKLCPNNAVFL